GRGRVEGERLMVCIEISDRRCRLSGYDRAWRAAHRIGHVRCCVAGLGDGTTNRVWQANWILLVEVQLIELCGIRYRDTKMAKRGEYRRFRCTAEVGQMMCSGKHIECSAVRRCNDSAEEQYSTN